MPRLMMAVILVLGTSTVFGLPTPDDAAQAASSQEPAMKEVGWQVRAAPRIEVLVPRDGDSISAPEGTVSVVFRILSDQRLRSVSVELLGENTGTLLSVCGERERPCPTGTQAFEHKASVPAFRGGNTIHVSAVDIRSASAEVVRQVRVTIPDPAAPRSRRPQSDLTPASLAVVRLLSPPSATSTIASGYALLVIAWRDVAGALSPLVAHKNATGMPTILWDLESIYEEPQYRGRDHAEIVKNAIAHAHASHGVQYVMLVGDVDRFPVRYTRGYDLGHWGHGFSPSDLYYADVHDAFGAFVSWDSDGDDLFGEGQANFATSAHELIQDGLDLLPDVAVGRLPASSATEVATYVTKVIAYEQANASQWYKRALLITGDYPNSNATNDAVGTTLQGRGFALTKLYHDAIWPTATYAQRVAMVEAALANGAGLVSYVGHGAGAASTSANGGLWGGWYDHSRIPFAANADRLPVIFSAACETGMFHSGNGPYFARLGFEHTGSNGVAKYEARPEPLAVLPANYDKDALAEHFLVKSPVGAIAFIGAYTGTQDASQTLARYFFEAYENGPNILGDMWNAAIMKFVFDDVRTMTYPLDSWYRASRYHHIHRMLLFGDPSLRLGGGSSSWSAAARCVRACDTERAACIGRTGWLPFNRVLCARSYEMCMQACAHR